MFFGPVSVIQSVASCDDDVVSLVRVKDFFIRLCDFNKHLF